MTNLRIKLNYFFFSVQEVICRKVSAVKNETPKKEKEDKEKESKQKTLSSTPVKIKFGQKKEKKKDIGKRNF